MNIVKLLPDGQLTDDQSGKAQGDPIGYLSWQVQLETPYHLRSYFRLIDRYPVLAKLNPFFPSLLEQYRASPTEHCTGSGFDALQFSKTVEMIGFPGKPRLEIYQSLKGLLGDETSDIKSSRLEGLLDLPLELGKLKHIVFGDKVDVFEFETVYTLFEFVDGIAWELSFLGTPETCAI